MNGPKENDPGARATGTVVVAVLVAVLGAVLGDVPSGGDDTIQ
jgi:hypothetical protein